MKKYVKPELFYERFELSQHIAVCAWDMNLSNKESCNAAADTSLIPDLAGETLFMSSSACSLNPDTYKDYCYHNGMSSANAFRS